MSCSKWVWLINHKPLLLPNWKVRWLLISEAKIGVFSRRKVLVSRVLVGVEAAFSPTTNFMILSDHPDVPMEDRSPLGPVPLSCSAVFTK